MKHRRSFLGLLFAAAMSAAAVMPAAAAHAATSVATTATYYTMELSPASATVRPGHKTTTTISFSASRRLYGTAVDLSVNGLPSGVTASFSPATPPYRLHVDADPHRRAVERCRRIRARRHRHHREHRSHRHLHDLGSHDQLAVKPVGSTEASALRGVIGTFPGAELSRR
jgi:hypothetical protein